MGNLNNFLYDSRNDDNLFNYSFDLNDFRYLNHLLYYFFNFNSDFFNTVHISRNLNDSLLNISHWFWYFHIMVYYFLYLNQFGLIHNHRVPQVNLFDYCILDPFNKRLFYDLSDFFYNFLDKWNFNYLLNFNRNLSDNFNKFFYDNFDWLDDLLSYEFLSDHFDFSDFYFFNDYFHNFLNDLRHFNNSLHSLDDGNYFFYNTVNWFVDCLNMIVDL